MSILIKGMEMPESCSNCELCACYAESKGEVYRCDITMYPVRYFEKRLDNCPLVEVPDDVQLVVHGYWKYETDYCLVCSECGNPAEINGITGEFMESPYCSECGARMDGET